MAEPQERGLFSAVVAVAAGLELGATLRRIVQSAVDLVDASYGALGVLGPRWAPDRVRARRASTRRRRRPSATSPAGAGSWGCW